MKKLSIVLLICILSVTFCFSGTVYAQEDEVLPDPGITPDSPFYFADRWAEQLSLMFTFRGEARVQKALQYAEERLAEMDAMLARNKVRATTEAADGYNNCLAIATQAMERAREKGINTSEVVALAASKHIEVLDDSIAGAPENAQSILTQARERARTCQETALCSLAQGDPEEAIRLNLRLMQRQLNRTRVCAEENETIRLQEELKEFERLGNLGEEISQIAKGLGNDTTVDQLIGQATAYHLTVLAEVHECVQRQAQQAVEDAMQVCVKNHERVVAALKEKNMLGQIPEEPPIPDEILEKIRQHGSSGGSPHGKFSTY